MKNFILPLFFLTALLTVSCGMESMVSSELMKGSDSVAADSIAAKTSDTLPHEVRKGKKSSYAFSPDTAFGAIILGNPDSFAAFWRKNGANVMTINDNRFVASFYNDFRSEWAAVYLVKNKARREVPYGIVVQKATPINTNNVPGAPLIISKPNFVSGHQVYIGMPYSYLLNIYTDQALTQWEKGDTLYLTYRPESKDAKFYRRFGWVNYSATYKFVDDHLRRIEYFADPAELESR
jgi:hypothetical protein